MCDTEMHREFGANLSVYLRVSVAYRRVILFNHEDCRHFD
jgi:hypothetical protein